MKIIDFSSTVIELQKNGDFFEIKNPVGDVLVRFKNFTGLVIVNKGTIIYEYQSK